MEWPKDLLGRNKELCCRHGQVNLCNLISNNGFRLVGLRPRGFLSSQFMGVFHVKILCLIAYLFIIAYILVHDIGKLFYWLVILEVMVVKPITNYCFP